MAVCWERAVPLNFHLCCFTFSAILVVRVPFPFGVWGRMWNSIVSVLDHCLFICFVPVVYSTQHSRRSPRYTDTRRILESQHQVPDGHFHEPPGQQSISQQRRKAGVYNPPGNIYGDYHPNRFSPRPREFRDGILGAVPPYTDHRVYNQPYYDADALADLADAAADRRNAMRELHYPDPPPPTRRRNNPGYPRGPAATNQQITSVEQFGMDPAVTSSLKSPARTLGADTISISQSVQREQPTTSSAQSQPMKMDMLFNEFVTFMAQRLQERPNSVGQSNRQTVKVWNESLFIEPNTYHLETSAIKPKLKLGSSLPVGGQSETDKHQNVSFPTPNLSVNKVSKSAQNRKQESYPETKRSTENSVASSIPKRAKSNNLATSKEQGVGYRKSKMPKYISETINDNAVQDQNTASTGAVSQTKSKTSDATTLQKRKSSQTGETALTASASNVFPDLSALQNIASFLSNTAASKTSNDRPQFVFVMIDSQGLVKSLPNNPIDKAMLNTPSTQNNVNNVKSSTEKHKQELISEPVIKSVFDAIAVAEVKGKSTKTEASAADKGLINKHTSEARAHKKTFDVLETLTSSGKRIKYKSGKSKQSETVTSSRGMKQEADMLRTVYTDHIKQTQGSNGLPYERSTISSSNQAVQTQTSLHLNLHQSGQPPGGPYSLATGATVMQPNTGLNTNPVQTRAAPEGPDVVTTTAMPLAAAYTTAFMVRERGKFNDLAS